MQTKDVPTIPILKYLHDNPFTWTMIWTIRELLPNIPEKLILAKMNKLIDRGFIEGCGCGCRGDFEITYEGCEYLYGVIDV